MNKIFKIAIAIIVCESAGVLGSLFTMPAITSWYKFLPKPFLNPPSWIFGPVWTLLYILMGVSLYLIVAKGLKTAGVKKALIVFGVQLVLNALWSIIFFGNQNPLGGLIDIVLMWISIVATIFLFYKISRPAAYLLVPYLLWVSFATYLNYSIFVLLRHAF